MTYFRQKKWGFHYILAFDVAKYNEMNGDKDNKRLYQIVEHIEKTMLLQSLPVTILGIH